MNFITDIKAETAYADVEYLEEVLSNLIDNSVKYSGESVEIRISTARDDRYTVLKVYDNGFGISDKDIQYPIKIFILFSESLNVHQPLSVTAGMVLPVSDSD